MAEILNQTKTDQITKQFPDDVLIEIFLRLPVRSLFLFRSVSKHWLSLIQNPNFITLLTNRPIDNRNSSHGPMLIARIVESESKPKTRNIVFTLLSDDETLPYKGEVALEAISPSIAERGLGLKRGKLHLMGPCNGLFCLTDRVDIVLFNPATRECRNVPSRRLSTRGSDRGKVATYFDCVGFGFDHVCNDYKVVRFRFSVQGKFGSFGVYNDDVDVDDDDDDDDDDNNDNGDDESDNDDDDSDVDDDNDNGDDDSDNDDDDNDDDGENDVVGVVHNDGSHDRKLKVEIFSLTTNCWRELDSAVSDFHINRIHGHSLFFNGAIHWLEGHSYNDITSILVFELNKEAFNRFELPCSFSDFAVFCIYPVILNESLAMILHWRLNEDVEFEIWVMKEYGVSTSWRVLYKISNDYGIDSPLSISKKREFLAVNFHGKLAVFNLNTGVIKVFQVRGVPGNQECFMLSDIERA